MSDAAVDIINAGLRKSKRLTPSELSKMVNDKKLCKDPEVRKAINEYYDRDTATYDWKADCLNAERKNRKLEQEIQELRQDMTFNYSRCAGAKTYIAIVIAFTVILLSIVFFRPALNNLTITRSGHLLEEMADLKAENAELQIRLEATTIIIDDLTKYVKAMNERTEEVRNE